uniref:NADH-ubiquinone oxidoreductase chain 5 n=1 Tax=Rhipicephalus microplus TaxID=6941 RepID=V9MM07_RHIMP|nr:NADH dehydrogenase subunit 5 [Rhipicephalus microplus]QGG43654.1 NADH dehydrogenase subunit 5 [Rhipicephalus microplus]QUX32192.1 NADH dehydrogenase subunit 5 [Rhipicephalus microplus]UNO54503.1 NADH dehydrogenase subunit 5 [Rhipicephalus microplus]
MFINWTLMLLMFSMFFLVCLLFLLYNNSFIIIEYSLVTILSHEFKFYILLDWMSCMFSFIVLLISSMVLWYSFSYMMLDKNKMSFCWMVLFFILSMLLLILMPNMCMLILGWDGLGLVSYCLVIYYQSVNSYNSGMMTIISNRVGDVMIIMMIIFAINFNSFELVSFRKFELIWGLLIIIAAMTKSAQIPFSAWLPAAMAAPTPVSALVHSSTLVTAGVYLLIRFNLLFNYSVFSSFLLKISLMTMVMAGINAFFENDLKKIIAFSTLSQLSIMMLTLALGLTSLSFFHLIVHAIFKSMLFLCAGFIIHNLMGNQDIRFLSNFFKFSPTILSCMIIGMLSLMGFPFIGGFYSKDIIMEFFFFKSQNMIEMILFIIGILFTFLYNMRLSYMILLKGTTNVSLLMNNLNVFMKYPILILSMKLIMMSNLMSWMIISNYSITFLSNQQKLMMMMMIFICIYVYNKSLSITYKFLMNMKFFMKMWYLNNLTSYILLSNNKRLLQMSINDWSWMEMMGPLGMKKMIMNNYNFSLIKKMNKFEIIFGMIFLMMFLFI